MKKIVFFIAISLISFVNISYGEECQMFRDYVTYNSKNTVADNAIKAYNNGKYEDSIKYWNNYLQDYYGQNESVKFACKINFAGAFEGLKLAYVAQAKILYEKEQFDDVISYLGKALQLSPKDFEVQAGLGYAYYSKGDTYNAINYFNEAYNNAPTKNDMEDIKSALDLVKMDLKYQSQKLDKITNDSYLFLQYYINNLNIDKAWKKVNNSKQVIVAIIDDGININHPDLKDNIWIDNNSKYGSSKVINFVGDSIGDNLPTGDHGTMVSGIIGATQNNDEGIAGIAKNVKLMPLRVFGTGGTADETVIIKAMNYAIDNGANIINLSLGGSQFVYSEKYDQVILKAYNKGVIVVIAAGNGDILSGQQVGVNLTNNPVSPICNNGGKGNKYSIGVYATDVNGLKTKWTNYGDCAPFMAPGVGIMSASIPLYNSAFGFNYNIKDGTSFSAPIISGIIALGYNQYGYVSPDVVFDSLKSSISKNSAGNEYVDAEKYIDILGTKMSQTKSEQKTNTGVVSNNLSSVESSQTISTNKQTLSNGDFLASAGIVKKQDSDEQYRLNDFVLRQEVIGIAIKLGKITLPDAYSCKGYFGDVSSIKPNNWACRAVEISADNGIITKSNPKFRPEDKITKAEALAILLKGAKINIEQSTSSNFIDVSVSWQINTINTALNKKIIDQGNYFFPNQNATRGEIFEIAKRILNLNN